MKTINIYVMINPSHNKREAVLDADILSADKYILIDPDLDFLNDVAMVLEKRKKRVRILNRLEGLEKLFPTFDDCRYNISVKCYA